MSRSSSTCQNFSTSFAKGKSQTRESRLLSSRLFFFASTSCSAVSSCVQLLRGRDSERHSRVVPPDICPQTLSLVWTSCGSPSCGCGRNWMLCRRISYSTVEPAWRCNSATGFPKTLTSFRRLVLTRTDSRLPFFRDLDPTDPDTWVHHKRDNLEAFVNRGGLVKVAFFGGLDTLQRIQDPQRAAGSRVRVASLVDLAGMKMRVIQVREIGRTTWTFTLWCRMGSICRQHWRQPKRSTKASIRRPAFAPYSFMATGHWIGSRRLCGGI